jgi:ATP adenylyltransferase
MADIMPPAPEPEAKRVRTDAPERPSPFRPPYVAGLYVGCVPGIDGEETMSILVSALNM